MLWGADGKWSGCGSLADERIPGMFTVFASLEVHREAALQAPACWGLKKFVCVRVCGFVFLLSLLISLRVTCFCSVACKEDQEPAGSELGREGEDSVCWRGASSKWVVKDFLRELWSGLAGWLLGRSCFMH